MQNVRNSSKAIEEIFNIAASNKILRIQKNSDYKLFDQFSMSF